MILGMLLFCQLATALAVLVPALVDLPQFWPFTTEMNSTQIRLLSVSRHVFRSDTPLIYKAVPSWFVRVEHMVDKLLENNGQCYWYVTRQRIGLAPPAPLPLSVTIKAFFRYEDKQD